MTDQVEAADNAAETEIEAETGAELDVETGETATAEGETVEKKEEKDPKDEQIAALQQQVREMDGRVGSERGHKLMLQKLVKEVEKKEGVINRDELAQAVGMDRKRLDGILDAPLVDDDGEFRRRAGAADKQLKAVAKVLKANGKDAEEISLAYGTLLSLDPAEREAFMNTPEEDLGSFIIERVGQSEKRVKRIVKAKGSALDALDEAEARIAELEAENEALKTKGQSKEQRVPLNGAPETHTPARRQGGSIYEAI